jgi:uncharacterized membrane-anchored protein
MDKMTNGRWRVASPQPVLAAALSGVVAVAVLSGMLVLHAWPLWTGEPVYLKVRPVDPRDLFRGDYVTLGYDIDTLRLRVPAEQQPVPAVPLGPDAPPEPSFPEVEPIGNWWRPNPATGGRSAAQLKQRIYLQLRPDHSSIPGVPVVHVPISISDEPVGGATNIGGRIRFYRTDNVVTLDFGIDALFVREGTGRPIENAIIDSTTPVYAEVAVTRSGAARVRSLVINGTRVP